MKRIPILVDESSEKFLFSIIGNEINRDGVVVDNRGIPVLTQDAENIKMKDLAIIRKGSKVFIKRDIVSLVKYAVDLI